MSDGAKRAAQEALFNAIKDQAETNMRSALRATEKAQLLRELAEAYRLTAGGTVRRDATPQGESAGSEGSGEQRQSDGKAGSRGSGGTTRKAAPRQAKPKVGTSRS